MNCDRDPRFTPKVGDIVHDGHTSREVTDIRDTTAGDICGIIVVTKVTPPGECDIWPSTYRDWRVWARYTRIMRYAEDL